MSQKETRDPLQYGNKKYGRIMFGHLHLGANPKNKSSDCTSGVMLQAKDSRHYTTMDIDGPREGWTINRSPGPYQIVCADDVDPESVGFMLQCKNGDLVIGAPNGNVRIYGINVDIMAKNGTDNTTGVINIESNEAVNIETQKFDVKAKTGIRIFTPYTMELVANTVLKIKTNFFDGLSSASSTKPSKTRPLSTKEYFTGSLYT
jgi:hypothetical protein